MLQTTSSRTLSGNFRLVSEADSTWVHKPADDAYTHFFCSVMRWQMSSSDGCDEDAKCPGVICAFIWMVFNVVVQFTLCWFFDYSLGGQKFSTSYVANVFNSSQLYQQTVSTRIAPSIAEEFCGVFVKETFQSGVYGYKPVAFNWADPVNSWPTEDVGKLQQAIAHREVLGSILMFTAFVIWAAIISWEIGDVFLFVQAVFNKLVPNDDTENEENDDCEVAQSCAVLERDGERISVVRTTVPMAGAALVILACRMAIALDFLGSGAILLMSANNYVDVIKDTVAMAFALEVDNLLHRAINSARGEESLSAKLQIRMEGFGRCRSPAVMLMFAAIALAVCFVEVRLWFSGRAVIETMFAAYASICLWLGPTPDLNLYFNASFAVPGFCESLVCKHVDGTACMRGFADSSTQYSVLQVQQLAAQCTAMYQGPTFTNYSFQNGSFIAPLGTRMADEDLAAVGITDDASNFWCPSDLVWSRLFQGKEADKQIMSASPGSFELGKFWEVLGGNECQSPAAPLRATPNSTFVFRHPPSCAEGLSSPFLVILIMLCIAICSFAVELG